MASLKVHLYTMFAACFVQALTQPFGIRSNHIKSLIVCGITSRVVGASFVVALGWSFDLKLYSVESPCRVFSSCQNFVQMLLYILL